jgi:phosphoglycerol transferase MdoB-like AlkP superfamily enzyme
VPPPPYALDFSADGRAPRVLQTSQEISVPLAVTNTGGRAWDRSAIHLSYHWLWLAPRELLRRSRTVPYHEGIRSELDRMVPPRGRLSVSARLLAPSWPGVYWLQWDMVEEGATWFAQVAPRQPRSLVVVVPPPAWMLAPLPLLVALTSVRRRRGRVPLADVWWCAATLAAKPLIVEHEALLEPTAVSYWLVAAIAIGVPALALFVLPARVRPWALLSIGIFASLVLLADVIYYRFFGDVVSAPAVLAAHQTGRVWGTVGSLFSPGLLWLVADWPLAAWLAAREWRAGAEASPRARAFVAAAATLVVVVGGVALSAPRVLASTPLDQMFRARSVVEQLGPLGYHAYDTWNYARSTWLRPPATDDEVRDAAAWFRDRARLRAPGPTFGAARGRNLIVVQVESLEEFAVNYRVQGQDVMPHLRRWSDDSLRFTGVTDQTSEGRTSDAEFATMTSLLPLDHGAAAFRFPANHYVALPRLLADAGFATVSAVAFEPGFWNRQVMHPAYGFQHSLFEPDFQMTEQIGWGLNDRDFLQQMVPRLERLPRPFAAWLITLSLHYPFASFPDAHKTLRLGALEGTPLGNYLHAMRFFDQALEDFRTALAQDGLLDQTAIVVFGDHDAGFVREPALARAIGIGADEVAWTLSDRVPLFIRTGVRDAAAAGLAGERAQPAGQTDFAPTLLSLFGIDAAPLPYVGRNLLGAPDDGPVPRPYGDWLDAGHLFLARGPASLCIELAQPGRRDPGQTSACTAADVAARHEREVSRLVVGDDLQQRLRLALGAPAR